MQHTQEFLSERKLKIIMEIKLQQITVRELVDGYVDNAEEGVI